MVEGQASIFFEGERWFGGSGSLGEREREMGRFLLSFGERGGLGVIEGFSRFGEYSWVELLSDEVVPSRERERGVGSGWILSREDLGERGRRMDCSEKTRRGGGGGGFAISAAFARLRDLSRS